MYEVGIQSLRLASNIPLTTQSSPPSHNSIPAQLSAPPARSPPPRPSFARAQAAVTPPSPSTLQTDLPSIARPEAHVAAVTAWPSSPPNMQTLNARSHVPEGGSRAQYTHPYAVAAAPSAWDAPTTPPRTTPPRMTPPATASATRPHHPTTTPPLALPTQRQVPNV